jgi:hypothetical protein
MKKEKDNKIGIKLKETYTTIANIFGIFDNVPTIYMWLRYKDDEIDAWYIGQSTVAAQRFSRYFMLRDGKWCGSVDKDFELSLYEQKNHKRDWRFKTYKYPENADLDEIERIEIQQMCKIYGVEKSYNTQIGGKNHSLLVGSIPWQRRQKKD